MNQFPSELKQPVDIASLKPNDLLQLKEINGIPISKLTRSLKPNRDWVRGKYKDMEIAPDEDILASCTPQEELPKVVIDSGLIGPHDEIQTVLALQRAYIGQILDNAPNPHQIVGNEITRFLDAVEKLPYGSGILDFDGLKQKKRLYVMRTSSPAPALSPFGDGDASNVSIAIYDITGVEYVPQKTLKECGEKGLVMTLSGLQEKFVKKYGFYEEAEPIMQYNDLFSPGSTRTVENNYAFLPIGLHILGISDKPVNELKSTYKDFQKQYKGR